MTIHAAPKPTKAKKHALKGVQRVYIRFSCGCWQEPCLRVGAPKICPIHGNAVEREYAVGKKRIGEHQALIDILDSLCSKIVVQRDGYQCVQCGSREHPQCGHVIVRGKWGTRWWLRNMNCQCSTCNYRHGQFQQAWYYYNWFKDKWGGKEWDNLCAKAESKANRDAWSVTELREMLLSYEALYEKIQTLTVYTEEDKIKLGLYG